LKTPKNGSVGKAFQILNVLATNQRGLSATDVAQVIGSNLPTVHRFLVTLEEVGAVSRTQQGKFQLGLMLANLGGKVESNKLLVEAVQPHLEEIAASLREATYCAVRNGQQAINIARALPDRSLLIGHGIGELHPLHCTAVGKMMLASLDTNARERLLDHIELERFTDHTIVDPKLLREQLTDISRRNYAIDDGEWEEGLRSIAVPLRNAKGKVVAAIALSAPVSRLGDDQLITARAALSAAAERLEHGLFTGSRVFPQKARPRGSFPHLKQVGDFIFISGTSARRPDDTFEGVSVSADGTAEIDIAVQTRTIFSNIGDMLSDVGAKLSDLVEVQAYLIDMRGYDEFNRVYSEFFDYQGPTRTTVGVSQLPHPHQGLMIRAIAHAPHASFGAGEG
jgi:DNA-binding IclR family transcriptional regulator/enamine deaminase RidA (YjgF/YER057c/UK114 family)